MSQKQKKSINSNLVQSFSHIQSMLVAASALVLVSLSACNNSSDNSPTQAVQSASPSATTQTAATTPPPPPAPQEFYVGDTLENGQLQVTLTAVKTGTTFNTPFEIKTASEGGQYVVVIVKEKNVGSKPINSFDMPRINLIDSNGNKYSEDIDASGAAATVFGDNSKILSDLNPGIATTSVKAFEVGKDAFNADAWHLKVGDAFVYRLVSQTKPPAQAAAEASPQTATEPPSQPAAAQANAPQVQAQQPPAQDQQPQAQTTQASTAQPADPVTDFNTNPNQVYGTSFDCGKSHSQNEYLICHTPGLAAADVKLANSVTAAKNTVAATDLDALKERMRGQWNFREKHCNDVACLNTWYQYQTNTMALIEQTRNVAARVDTPQS